MDEKTVLLAIALFGFGAVVGVVVDRLAFQRAVLIIRDELGRVKAVQGTYQPQQ
jgi:hypothetical protein